MTMTERRQAQRCVLEKLVYIEIGKNNGGIVLNMSEGGLCFQSAAPVGHNGTLKFSILENDRVFAACGEIAWIDEAQQLGGVRFTALSPEAREQISEWTCQAVTAPSMMSDPELKFARLNAARSFVGTGDDLEVEQPSMYSENESPNRRLVLSRFAVGLVTGVLISALGFGLFSLVYGHRQGIGESLIHLGERMAGKSDVQNPDRGGSETQTLASVVPLPPRDRKQTATATASGGTLDFERVPAKPILPRPTSTTKPSELRAPVPLTQHNASRANSALTESRSAAALETPPAPLVADVMSDTRLIPPTIDTVEIAASGGDAELVERESDMYLELARFTDQTSADKLRTRVAQLGLDVSVFKKTRVPWKDFYQVVVGPYSNEEEEKKIVKTLRASGYRPRAYERGSRNFTFPARVILNGSTMPVGGTVINWESHVAHAKVDILQGADVIKSATGRWVSQPKRYLRNEIVYVKNSEGSKALVEIHFYGQKRALVFRTAGKMGPTGISSVASSGQIDAIACNGVRENCIP